MARFIVHIFILCIVIYFYFNPTSTSLLIEEKGRQLWGMLLEKFNYYVGAEKSATKNMTSRLHF